MRIRVKVEGTELSVIVDMRGDPWWVASEVCGVLGLKNAPQAVRPLDDDEKSSIYISDSTSGNPNKTIINEPGLYQLIFKSKKPEAKLFRRWVTHDVLPQIRKTGSYSARPEVASSSLCSPTRRADLVCGQPGR
jgi:anti-repressor protein